ncbi:MAG: hypothetical protein ACTS8P_01295 [Arsenophonus sp. NC-XBC3-MAG3]
MGDAGPSFTTIQKWVTEFKHDCTGVEDPSIFWDAKGLLLLIDYLKNGQRINRDCYANLLGQLNVKILEKRLG